MKWITIISFLLSIFLPPGYADAGSGKTKIAVLDFQLQGDTFPNDDMGAIVAEWFTTAMVKAGRFDMVERSLLQKVLGEQKLVMTGMVDTGSATQIGKLLGAKVIVTGSVMRLGEMFEINARMIDVESTSIISAEHEKTAAMAHLQDMVESISKKMIGKSPLEGFVVNRTKQEIGIDLGIHSGVQEGMRFTVFRKGKEIQHPVTGEVLDIERIETGTVTIVAVMEKISKALISAEVTPGAIEYGQSVKSVVGQQVKEAGLPVALPPARLATSQNSRPIAKGSKPATTDNKEAVNAPRATMGAFSFVLPEGWVKLKDTDLGDIYAKIEKDGDPHALVQFDSEIVTVDRQGYEKNVIARLKEYKADRIDIAGSSALQLRSFSEDSGTVFFIFPHDNDGTGKVTVIYQDNVESLSSEVLNLLATVKIAKHLLTGVNGPSFKDSVTGMEFVLVPGSCFQMGDTFGGGKNDERPVHEVCLDSFYMGKYEVTQGEYRRVMNENPSQVKKGDNLPVESVSWEEAQIFIEKLNSLSGRRYRLPTEAEWEFSARSGGKEEKYAGGNDVSAVAWYVENSGASIKAGGGKQPNGLGLYDMSGNVSEWCHDWADGKFYETSGKDNPYGPSSGTKRIVRGGGGNSKAEAVRTSRRTASDPGKGTIGVGLRLAHPPH